MKDKTYKTYGWLLAVSGILLGIAAIIAAVLSVAEFVTTRWTFVFY